MFRIQPEVDFRARDYVIQGKGHYIKLTHSYPETPKRVMRKQCRPRSDATNGLVQHITVAYSTIVRRVRCTGTPPGCVVTILSL